MPEYQIVKHCRLCKERFVVGKGESKIYYCKKCQAKVDEYNQSEEAV